MRRELTYLGFALLVCTVAIPQAVADERRAEGQPSVPLHSLGFEVQSWPARAAESEDDRISILVELVPRAQDDLKAASARLQVRSFAESVGGFVHREYRLVPNLVNLRDIPRLRLQDLKRIPGVVRIEEDQRVRSHLNGSMPLIRGLRSQLDAAGFSATGAGVRICIVDTGVDSDHLMYADRIDTGAGWDFVDNDADPEDSEGHGSHVAGIAAGRTGLVLPTCGGDQPFQGIAPEATLIAARVLDNTGSGFASDVIAGIDHCAAVDLPGGQADVINLSLGFGLFTGGCDTFSVSATANAAVDAGVVVVASASNDGATNALAAPACASKVISVGATYDDNYPNCELPDLTSLTFCLGEGSPPDCEPSCTDDNITQDQRVCFSNQSPNLDVVAPGCVIFSADPETSSSVIGTCGTSQSAPHVAGLAALILDSDPFLSPAAVRQIIRDGAVDLGDTGFDPAFGYGRIDVINSLQLAQPDPCDIDADCDDGVFCNGEER